MSNYAFEDKERKVKIYADQAIKKNLGKLYYCPTTYCDAHLFLCSVDGLNSPHFRATKKDFPHSDNCAYKRNIDFNVNNVKEDKFDFNDIVEGLLKTSNNKVHNNTNSSRKYAQPNSSENKIERIKTLKQLYAFLKSKDVQEIYNNSVVGFMLLDDRSLFMHSKGVFGNKVIESRVFNGKFYDSQKQEIKFEMLNNDNYTFILKFSDEKIFKDVRDIVYNNREKIFILVGNWKKESFNHFSAEFRKKAQMYILK